MCMTRRHIDTEFELAIFFRQIFSHTFLNTPFCVMVKEILILLPSFTKLQA